MSKKEKARKSGPALGGLADALIKAGVAEEGQGQKSRHDRRREEKALGEKGVAARTEQERAERDARRAAEADAARQRELSSSETLSRERLELTIRTHRDASRGNKRWFFVARDGRIPFVDVSDTIVHRLSDGHAGIVESLGVFPDEHVVVADEQALAALKNHDPEVVRCWRRDSRKSG